MSTDSADNVEREVLEAIPITRHAPGFPPPRHPAEADSFAQQRWVPGHRQDALKDARILLVGAGGLGSWVAVALARSGATGLTIVEPDRFVPSNAARQFMFAGDVGKLKAVRVAENLMPHMVERGRITAIPRWFAEADANYILAADVVICVVDNNHARADVVRFALRRNIPAVFGMLSTDSLRLQVFLQMPGDACIFCGLPNLDINASAPCAFATINSCLLAAALVSFLAHRALMGWPGESRWNFREIDLLGELPDRVENVRVRPACPMCSTD